jgi:hypothetical protein
MKDHAVKIKRQVWLIVIAALLGFSCAPSFSLASAPTLDPLSMNTAIALTADAASAQTAAVAQGSQPIASSPLALSNGPTLDAASLGTAIAETSVAAIAQTQALIPNTLTPSLTPLPSKTPTITPTVTQTFVITLPPTATRPGPIPTSRGGGGGDGGGDGGDDITLPYTCKVTRVTPKNETKVGPNTRVEIVWLVKNTGDNWHKRSVHLVYAEGTLIPLVKDKDLPPLSPYDISGGDIVPTPPVIVKTPSKPGVYWTSWLVYVGNSPACNLRLTLIVQNPK